MTILINQYNIGDLLIQNGFKHGTLATHSTFNIIKTGDMNSFEMDDYFSDLYFIKHIWEKKGKEPTAISGILPPLRNELLISTINNLNSKIGMDSCDFKINLSRITSKKLYSFFKEILDLKDFKNLNKKNSHWKYTLKDFLNCVNPNDYINIDLPIDMDCDFNEYLLKNLPDTVKYIQPLQNKNNLTDFTALNEDGSIIKLKFIN